LGIVLNWNSGYNGTPGSVDDTITNFPVMVDGVHDVLASHVNELAQAVIQLQTSQVALNNIEVQDESVSLTAAATTLNFLGAGVTAASGGSGVINITIPGVPASSVTDLQTAYDGGNTVTTSLTTPISVTATGDSETSLQLSGPTDSINFSASSIVGSSSGSLTLGSGATPLGAITSAGDITAVSYVGTRGRFGAGSAADNSIQLNGTPGVGMYFPTTAQVGISAGGANRVTISASTNTTTNVSQGPNGSAAATTYGFSGEAGSGMFLELAGRVGLSTAGTQRAAVDSTEFSSTVPFRGPNGLVSSVGLGFDAEPNTGLYRVSPNVLGVAVAGVQTWALTNSLSQSIQILRVPEGSGATPGLHGPAADTGIRIGAVNLGLSISGNEELTLSASEVSPTTDEGLNLGSNTQRFGQTYQEENILSGAAGSTERVHRVSVASTTISGSGSNTLFTVPFANTGPIVNAGRLRVIVEWTAVGDSFTEMASQIDGALFDSPTTGVFSAAATTLGRHTEGVPGGALNINLVNNAGDIDVEFQNGDPGAVDVVAEIRWQYLGN
jgi:hypothetical protein